MWIKVGDKIKVPGKTFDVKILLYQWFRCCTRLSFGPWVPKALPSLLGHLTLCFEKLTKEHHTKDFLALCLFKGWIPIDDWGRMNFPGFYLWGSWINCNHLLMVSVLLKVWSLHILPLPPPPSLLPLLLSLYGLDEECPPKLYVLVGLLEGDWLMKVL